MSLLFFGLSIPYGALLLLVIIIIITIRGGGPHTQPWGEKVDFSSLVIFPPLCVKLLLPLLLLLLLLLSSSVLLLRWEDFFSLSLSLSVVAETAPISLAWKVKFLTKKSRMGRPIFGLWYCFFFFFEEGSFQISPSHLGWLLLDAPRYFLLCSRDLNLDV